MKNQKFNRSIDRETLMRDSIYYETSCEVLFFFFYFYFFFSLLCPKYFGEIINSNRYSLLINRYTIDRSIHSQFYSCSIVGMFFKWLIHNIQTSLAHLIFSYQRAIWEFYFVFVMQFDRILPNVAWEKFNVLDIFVLQLKIAPGLEIEILDLFFLFGKRKGFVVFFCCLNKWIGMNE